MTKKKILIYCCWFKFGGGEKSLVNLLNIIPKDEYDITLMLYNNNFSLLKYIPNNVKIVKPPYKLDFYTILGIKRLVKLFLKQRKYFSAINLFVAVLLYKLLNFNYLLKTLLFKKQNKNIKYDYIFNWSGVDRIGDIVCNDLYQYNKNYILIHLDFFNNKLLVRRNKKFIKKYDYIVCVSKELTDKVKILYKDIAYKIVTLYNPVDTDTILKLSNSIGFKDNYNGFRLLSVGRLSYVKGFDIAIKACKILIDNGYKFKWYIMGEGKERENLTKLIKENNLENKFVLLGEKENPYPFFKECDIYIQTSRSETYCLTLSEAKIFNKPIVTTIFLGTYEQIKDKETGIIVETTPEGIAAGVQQLLDNKELREKLINNLKIENQKPKPDYFAELKKYL